METLITDKLIIFDYILKSLNELIFYKLRKLIQGPLAQLARAPALQAGGRGFESHKVHHAKKSSHGIFLITNYQMAYLMGREQPSDLFRSGIVV